MVSATHQQAVRMGAPRAIALCRSFGGFLRFQLGDWAQAESELREAIALYRETGSASGEALSLQKLGVLLTARGEIEEGMASIEEGISAAERATMRSHCLTRLYASMARNRLAAGEPRAAEELIIVGEETARRHGHCLTCNALLLPEAVRARISVGRVEIADREAGELGIAGRFRLDLERHGTSRPRTGARSAGSRRVGISPKPWAPGHPRSLRSGAASWVRRTPWAAGSNL
jgi:hypothetical protein